MSVYAVIIQMQNNPARRVLPPGIDDDVVFGILWIRVGTFKSIKPTPTAHKVNIQFWGEASPAILYTSQTNQTPVEYDIKCPVTFFEKYLIDMKKNLRIEVQSLGNVFLDLTTYLKKNLTLTSKSPFDRFKGFFQVIGKNNKKVGSIELQFCANFNPQIALREFADDVKQEECPAEKVMGCECKGVCKCSPNKVTALDVLAVQNPGLFKDFYEQSKERSSPKRPIPIAPINDNRIPNSLNNIPNRGVFDPNKYTEQMHTPKGNQHFPTVQKILTYSNLKLKKEESNHNRQSSRPISIKQHLNPPSQPISGNVLKPPTPIPSKVQFASEQISKPTAIFASIQKKNQQRYFQKEDEEDSTPIIPVVQGKPIKEVRNLSDVSEVQKMDESVSVQAQKEILSRVVNLNQQLQKERKVSPKKQSAKQNYLGMQIQKNAQFNDMKPLKALPLPPHLPFNLIHHQKRKGSTLLMNMVIELQTNSVSFDKKAKYILSYRPYGQKDCIRTGPQLPSNFIMMFPVGQPQIAKMSKVPFILQFWGANTEELLGVIKLSLRKIEKGFILDGRLNELAIKTSLLPTVIHSGIHPINNLIDKPVGQCILTAHIGTAAQIQSYLNTPREKNITKTQPQEASIKKQQTAQKDKPKRIKGNFEDFTNLLELIDSSTSQNFVQNLLKFMSLKQVNHEQFEEFLVTLPFNGGDTFHFLEDNDKVRCKQLSDCFQDYKIIKEKYLSQASSILKGLTKPQLSNIIQTIKERSNFGMISKQDLSSILQDKKFDLIKSFLNDITESANLIQWIKSQGKLPFKQIKVEQQVSRQFIEQLLVDQVPNYIKIIQDILSSTKNNNEISLSLIKSLFIRSNKQTFSLWYWLQLQKIVYDCFGQALSEDKAINTSLLYNWMVIRTKKNEKQPLKQEQDNIHIIQQMQQRKQQKEVEISNTITKKEQNLINSQAIMQPIVVKEETSQRNKENTLRQVNISNEKNEQKQAIKQQQKFTQHKFIISLQQLNLQQDLSGQCSVFYRFPFEEQQISSRRIQLLREKHKYKLACSGTHKFTINQTIQQYLGQSTLSIRVVIGKESQLYGDIHSEELITKGCEYRVVPLFTANREGMVGNIKIKAEYIQSAAQQSMLGRQTIRDVFLPKNGYLNFQMATTVDQNRLRQQFNIKDDFYIQISLDFFGQNDSLSTLFPPFYSKLYSDLSSQLSVAGSIKLSLTPQVLQHLRSGNCHARMLAIYYAKQKGNYERKDLLVASFKAPLFAVIRQNGLKGDYAFKNRLGMFVSLAHCTIRYDKAARIQEKGDNHGLQSSHESFWLVIDFTQVINFEGDLGGVRFEIVSKGKRYSTEKAMIRQMGAFMLESKCLCLQMGQEQFSITKILAINVIAGSDKYGVDMNLRPIAKSLGRQKYSVNSHYFVVVDDQSRSKKIRIGAKIYAFRGQASLGPFVQTLSKNTIRNDVIAEQKEQKYQQNLQMLRKRLKMSTKAFEGALGQFLDRKKKEKLPSLFFTSKIHSSLDLSPILTFNQADVELLAEQLASQIDQRSLLQYIEQSGLKLVNLRSQFLQRYSFNKLNQLRLDQNVEYLNLNQQIDLLVFVSKIRVQEVSHIEDENNASNEKIASNQRMVRISIIRGYNFQLLYNGIMPNARVCLPQIGLQTQLVIRSSQPVFNEHINFQIAHSDLKKLKIQVYHQSSEDAEAIMIGQGHLSLNQALNSRQIPFSKVSRVVLTSLMSNRMQAALDVKIQISQKQQNGEKSYSELDESIGDSRVEEAMERIHKLNDYKKKVALFDSSDEDY